MLTPRSGATTKLPMDEHVLQPLHLRNEEHVIVLRPVLGLTCYLAEPAAWAREHVREALKLFLATVPNDPIGFYVTSRMRSWRSFRPGELDEVVDEMTSTVLAFDRPRHLLTVKLSDWPNTPSLGWSYTEIEPARAARAAVLELTLPPLAPPDELMQLALQIANLGPLHAAVGGYAVRWNRGHQRKAFEQFHRWAQRFVGLDASDPEEMAWRAPTGLPGTGWLTVIGDALARQRELSLDRLAAHAWTRDDIRAIPAKHGLVIRAGEAPTVGDGNRLEFPEAYSEVARALAPWLTDDPPRLWSDFYLEDRTTAWFRRFVEPTGWPGDAS